MSVALGNGHKSNGSFRPWAPPDGSAQGNKRSTCAPSAADGSATWAAAFLVDELDAGSF